jgi:formylglycine-generating enzyme required for sulfatase activity
MSFSLVRSLVKNTLKHIGDGLTGGVIPVGTIGAGIYEEWCNSETPAKSTDDKSEPTAASQLKLHAEFESIVQDCGRYRKELESILAEMNVQADLRGNALAYLNQVPGRIQSSMRRPEDPSGRTIPVNWSLHSAEALTQFLPEKMPRFQPGDRAVAGTDLILQELLGVGGFGEVWKAAHQSRPHAAAVALKFCTDEAALGSLRKEVELLDRVANQGRHRGIVELKYAHLDGAAPCLEYEFVDGGDLAGLMSDLHRTGRAQPMSIAKILYSLALSVGFAHRLKPPIVHRDLKPQNILTTRKDGKIQFKVADFGIGAIASNQALRKWDSETQAGSVPGTQSTGSCTPLYASPQQRRYGPPDPRDDVYALGVIWYQLLTGDTSKEPPRGGTWKKKLLERGVSQEMTCLVERCIEDDPAERPADAQVLAEEISKIVAPGKSAESQESAEELKEIKAKKPDHSRQKRSPVLWLALSAGLLAALITGVVLFWQTANGTVRIESDDPSVEIVFDKDGPTIKGADKEPIALRAGEHGVRVKRGDFTFDTDKILIKKKELITLKIELLKGKIQVVADGRVIGAADLPPIGPIGVRPATALAPTFKNRLGMEFVLVPKGKSWLGGGNLVGKGNSLVPEGNGKLGTEYESDDDFYLGAYEVTQEEYEKVTGLTPSYFSRTGAGKNAVKDITDADLKRFPVEGMSWDEAQSFLEKLNKLEKETGWIYRLPKEAEWEYACRGGPMADKSDSANNYYFGKPSMQLVDGQANWEHFNCLKRTCMVGSFKPNGLGLYDMHGNVAERCHDRVPADMAEGRGGRGGSWSSVGKYCSAEARGRLVPTLALNALGIRVARVPSGK